MFGLALSITHDRSSAEEAAQEAFVKAWRYAASYDPRRGPVAAWILTIARNAALDQARARSRRLDQPALDAGDDIVGVDGIDCPYEELAALADAVRALPEEQRAVLMATVYRGHTTREISDVWELPLGTVKTRLRLALSKLRDHVVEVAR